MCCRRGHFSDFHMSVTTHVFLKAYFIFAKLSPYTSKCNRNDRLSDLYYEEQQYSSVVLNNLCSPYPTIFII